MEDSILSTDDNSGSVSIENSDVDSSSVQQHSSHSGDETSKCPVCQIDFERTGSRINELKWKIDELERENFVLWRQNSELEKLLQSAVEINLSLRVAFFKREIESLLLGKEISELEVYRANVNPKSIDEQTDVLNDSLIQNIEEGSYECTCGFC
ncbi:hypothetical protein DICVIV_13633 [Dictyocaulus viviparus]|uniref:Uncharacterized protein n=1 Tax=Dictyocaulus viviparus TaxID=29172 RepID=A0A0D8X7B0_DICVI|nr:hypothetical protein DICVIV_13633 [Dictyocaulus viviparus]